MCMCIYVCVSEKVMLHKKFRKYKYKSDDPAVFTTINNNYLHFDIGPPRLCVSVCIFKKKNTGKDYITYFNVLFSPTNINGTSFHNNIFL